MNTQSDKYKIAIIGLGYVGLPLLCHFSMKYQCYGLDFDKIRINQLLAGVDDKHCVNHNLLSFIKQVKLTCRWNDLYDCNIFIVCAPTPIDYNKKPNLQSLKDICLQLGFIIKRGSIIVFESTVAPGTTEDICVPIIEKASNLKLNDDFHVGFSPERINIGDIQHQLSNIPKIVSASSSYALSAISRLYHIVLGCDIVQASSIKVAEAAKLYENVQRDVLIALANQYSNYCEAERIDINEVTQCASTKWNFAEIYPGLVGGHCIGVDTYYLISKAREIGANIELVQKAREINESETEKTISQILSQIHKLNINSVLLIGLTYKRDTTDLRNSQALEIARRISKQINHVSVYDPNVSRDNLPIDIQHLYCNDLPKDYVFDAVITLVNHSSVSSPFGSMLNMNINK